MRVFWLEQTSADVPAGDEWLSSSEQLRLSELSVPKRRSDWRLGRWTAKRAIANQLGEQLPLASIEIHAAASGAPEVFVDRKPAAFVISLTHSNGLAACAVACAEARLGCDVELVEPHSVEFVSDYFTSAEQRLLARSSLGRRPLLSTLVWSAKESALKALHAGLTVDTRSVEAHFDSAAEHQAGVLSDWQPFTVALPDRDVLTGWWAFDGRFVRTLSARPSPEKPLQI